MQLKGIFCMFEMKDTKIFKDIVHGYISIPKVFVSNIIDTKWFQRLRFIEQTGMKVVYPDGKHDRFCHSLGVYYIGLKAVDALLENFRNESFWNIRSDNTCDVFWAKNKVLFLIACLLHDVGHAPFSHSLEDVILTNSGVNHIERSIVDKINEYEHLSPDSIEKPLSITNLQASAHEKIGALFVIEHLRGTVEQILIELKNYPKTEKIYAEYAQDPPTIGTLDLDADLCFIVRMILGLKYNSFIPEKQIQNCFIDLLNNDNFDVDKLDYIIRDTKMSGISNIMVDVERLLGSLTIVTTTRYKDYVLDEITGNFKDKNIFIKEIKTNDSHEIFLKGKVSGLIQLESKASVYIKENSTFLRLKPSISKFPEHHNNGKMKVINAVIFDKKTEVYRAGNKIPIDKKGKVVPIDDYFHTYIINNATVKPKEEFNFKIDNKSFIDLDLQGYSNIKILGSINIDSANFIGTLTGMVSSMSVEGDHLKKHNRVPTKNEYNEFSIGFKKQAINIIANVLDARDYLYLWIYAHHKVIYYANYLLPQLSEVIAKFIKKDRFPSWELKYGKELWYLDDAYMMTMLKYIDQHHLILGCGLTEEEKTLLTELFNRKYKTSLYKSLVEYDLMFADFTVQQKQNIRIKLPGLSETQNINENIRKDEEMTYGVLKTEKIDEIARISKKDLSFLKKLVWVDASYKYSKIDFAQVYSVFPGETTTMKRLNLLSSRIPIHNITTNHYFYLYYELKETDEKNDYSTLIKNALIIYFKHKLRMKLKSARNHKKETCMQPIKYKRL